MRCFRLIVACLFLASCKSTLDPNIPSYDCHQVVVGLSHITTDITWTNTGTQRVTVVAATGASGPFTLRPPTYAAVLPGGQTSGPIRVLFAPTAVGTFTTDVNLVAIGDNGRPVSATAVTVKGEGVALAVEGDLSISVPLPPGGIPGGALDFGSVLVNAGPAVTRTFTLGNGGTSPITVVLGVYYGGLGFTVVNPNQITIEPLRSKDVRFRFLPVFEGQVVDVAVFRAVNDAGTFAGAGYVTLTGVGVLD
jgi:hypothetical protein